MNPVIEMPNNVKSNEPTKSWWSGVVSSVNSAAKTAAEQVAASYLDVEKVVSAKAKEIMPVIQAGAEKTLSAVDSGCMIAAKSSVDFLVKYPGIAMVLSPQTVVRMAVKQHYEGMTGTKVSGSDVANTLE